MTAAFGELPSDDGHRRAGDISWSAGGSPAAVSPAGSAENFEGRIYGCALRPAKARVLGSAKRFEEVYGNLEARRATSLCCEHT